MGGPTPAEQYRAECEALKVPIPRDWGAAGAWTSRGFHKKPFIITTLDAELYIGNPRAGDPKGVCLALPRYDKSQVPEEQAADTFGIICMGEATSPDANGKQRSSACFWDWQNQNRSVPISGEVVPLSEFASAPEFVAGIGGVCSDCHAGQNAFVVHPGDTAFTAGGLNLDATAWVMPKVQATWPQNPIPDRLNTKLNALLAAGDKDCRRCHDMPEIVTTPPLKEYCRNVLWTSLFGRRVPLPDGTAGTAGPTMPITGTAKDYFKIVDALMAECKRAKAVLPPPQAPAAPRVHF